MTTSFLSPSARARPFLLPLSHGLFLQNHAFSVTACVAPIRGTALYRGYEYCVHCVDCVFLLLSLEIAERPSGECLLDGYNYRIRKSGLETIVNTTPLAWPLQAYYEPPNSTDKGECLVVWVSPRVTEEDETALIADGTKNLPTCANPPVTDPLHVDSHFSYFFLHV